MTQLPKIQRVWPLLKEGKTGALLRHTLFPRTYCSIEKMKRKLIGVSGAMIFTQPILQAEDQRT